MPDYRSNENFGKMPFPFTFSANAYSGRGEKRVKRPALSQEKNLEKLLSKTAFQKISIIMEALMKEAEKRNIGIVETHLNIEKPDRVKSFVFVKLEDFIDNKIFKLFYKASELARDMNDSKFYWESYIYHYTDTINTERFFPATSSISFMNT